jgi:deoxyribodipyrimidine photo-lyase
MRDKDIIAWSKKEKIKFTEFPSNGVVRRLKSRNEWNKIWNTRMSQSIVFPQKLSEKI